MKHVINIIKILTKYILVILAMVGGLFILPIAVLFRKPFDGRNESSRPTERFSSDLVNSIYGNNDDGFGDSCYRRDFPVDTYWSRLNWCMLRNPTFNLSERFGVFDKTIVKSEVKGNPNVTDDPLDECCGLKIQECWDDEGNYYPMYYYCQLWRNIIPFGLYKGDRGVRILMGYKNFCVKELGEKYTYNFVCAFTPFKLFVIG